MIIRLMMCCLFLTTVQFMDFCPTLQAMKEPVIKGKTRKKEKGPKFIVGPSGEKWEKTDESEGDTKVVYQRGNVKISFLEYPSKYAIEYDISVESMNENISKKINIIYDYSDAFIKSVVFAVGRKITDVPQFKNYSRELSDDNEYSKYFALSKILKESEPKITVDELMSSSTFPGIKKIFDSLKEGFHLVEKTKTENESENDPGNLFTTYEPQNKDNPEDLYRSLDRSLDRSLGSNSPGKLSLRLRAKKERNVSSKKNENALRIELFTKALSVVLPEEADRKFFLEQWKQKFDFVPTALLKQLVNKNLISKDYAQMLRGTKVEETDTIEDVESEVERLIKEKNVDPEKILIAFDIDQTLIDSHNPIEANVSDVLKRLKDKGCKIILLTARGHGNIYEKYEVEKAIKHYQNDAKKVKNDLKLGNIFWNENETKPIELGTLELPPYYEKYSALFTGGILYAGYEKKKMLNKLLKIENFNAKYLFFIDDKLDMLKQFEVKEEGDPYENVLLFHYQYTRPELVKYLDIIKATELHKEGFKGKGGEIIVIDNYIDREVATKPNVEMVDKNKWKKAPTTASGRKVTEGHGSHVSGIIHSIAPEATIKFISRYQKENDLKTGKEVGIENTRRALRLAATTKGDVVNMSFSLDLKKTKIIQALKDIVNSGKVIVKSIDNDANEKPEYVEALLNLAKDPEMKGRFWLVTNVYYDRNGRERLSASTNFPFKEALKSHVLSAPGTNIKSPWYEKMMSGTSQSAPMVTGAYILLKQAVPGLEPEEYMECLKDSARKISLRKSTEFNYTYGWGVIDIEKAYELCKKKIQKRKELLSGSNLPGDNQVKLTQEQELKLREDETKRQQDDEFKLKQEEATRRRDEQERLATELRLKQEQEIKLRLKQEQEPKLREDETKRQQEEARRRDEQERLANELRLKQEQEIKLREEETKRQQALERKRREDEIRRQQEEELRLKQEQERKLREDEAKRHKIKENIKTNNPPNTNVEENINVPQNTNVKKEDLINIVVSDSDKLYFGDLREKDLKTLKNYIELQKAGKLRPYQEKGISTLIEKIKSYNQRIGYPEDKDLEELMRELKKQIPTD